MKIYKSTRCLILAAACIAPFETACTTDGHMMGVAPEGSTYKPVSNSGNGTSSDGVTAASTAVATGNFKPLINKGGVAACMAITEQDVPTNYWQTVGLGAAVGGVLLAILGAAAGAAIGGGRGAVIGAAAGGAVGFGAGAASGVQTAEQKKEYAIQLARYDCQIEAAQDENESLKGAGDRLQSSCDTLTRQLDQLDDDYANKRLNRAQAQKELNDIDDASASVKTRLANMQDNAGKYQQYASSTENMAKGTQSAIDDARVSALSKEIDEMKSRSADLEADYNRLVERRKALVLQ